MPILVQDSFTDTNGVLLQNHTPEIGGAWIQDTVGGTAEINTNRLRNVAFDAHYGNAAIATLPNLDVLFTWVASSTPLVEANVRHAVPTIAFTGYRARYDTDHYDLIAVPNPSDNIILTSLTEAIPTLPAQFLFQFRPFGNPRLILTVNGVQKLTSNDGRIGSCNRVGLIVTDLVATATQIDNFLAIESPQVVVQQSLNIVRTSDRVNAY